MNDAGWHAGQNGNGTSQLCPAKKNMQVRCSMGEPHSGHRASAAGVVAEIRKSITSADTDFSIGGIAPPSRLSAVSCGHSESRSYTPRVRIAGTTLSLNLYPITIFVNRVTVFIGLCGIKLHRFPANRATRKVRRGLHVRHLKLSPGATAKDGCR